MRCRRWRLPPRRTRRRRDGPHWLCTDLSVSQIEQDGEPRLHDVHLEQRTLEQRLCFQNFEQSRRYYRVLRDLSQGCANDARARGGRLGKLDGGLSLGGRVDDVDPIRAVLLNRGGYLTQAVDHFLLDLRDHALIAKVDFSDVDAADIVA